RFSSPETRDADCRFAAEVLGYKWRVGQASLDGEARQVPTRYKAFTGGVYDIYSTLNADSYVVESPDAVFPADTSLGATLMRYTENNIPAATAFAPATHRAVVIGFPFEAIKSDDARKSLMKQILNFFDKR
ncbi:MAG: xanthan lyase, partial [Muribaculaceae bacterium]|nr:xanthan lyase [Muribaculaceae bacterium]